MIPSLIEFSPRPDLLRRTIERRKPWIESKLGVSLAECVLLEVTIDLAQIALECELNLIAPQASTRASKLLRKLVIAVEVPPDELPMLTMSKALPQPLSWMRQHHRKQTEQKPRLLRPDVEWVDCPVMLQLSFVAAPIIAWTISCLRGPGAIEEEPFNVLIVPRHCIERVVRIVDLLDRPDRTPKLITVYGDTQRVLPCAWEEMTLDPQVATLLKSDFQFYISNKKWFRKAHLPYRRGYLLHGPPGNGKTTAVRCMMSAYGLTAYTIRLFDRETDDSTLQELFARAMKNSPAIVLLEDIDRAFPGTGESKCGISLPSLLNTLDGAATGGRCHYSNGERTSLARPRDLASPRQIRSGGPLSSSKSADALFLLRASGSRYVLGVIGNTRSGVRWLFVRATAGDVHHCWPTRFYGPARRILRRSTRGHRDITRDHRGRIAPQQSIRVLSSREDSTPLGCFFPWNALPQHCLDCHGAGANFSRS